MIKFDLVQDVDYENRWYIACKKNIVKTYGVFRDGYNFYVCKYPQAQFISFKYAPEKISGPYKDFEDAKNAAIDYFEKQLILKLNMDFFENKQHNNDEIF